MTNRPTDEEAAIRRLSTRTDRPRPLDAEARARVEARLDRAFDAALAGDDHAPSEADIAPIARVESARRQRRAYQPAWMAVAAACVLVVGAFVLLRLRDETPARTDAVVPAIPDELLQPDVRWVLSGEMSDPETGTTPSLIVRIIDSGAAGAGGPRVVPAEARVSTDTAPPEEYLGTVRFEVDDGGVVRLPVVLLAPQRAWVDCDALIDLTEAGTASCGSDVIEYVPAAGAAAELTGPLDTYRAVPVRVEWHVADDASTTTIWTAAGVGPVRLDVEDAGRTTTYELTDFDEPTSTSTDTGD